MIKLCFNKTNIFVLLINTILIIFSGCWQHSKFAEFASACLGQSRRRQIDIRASPDYSLQNPACGLFRHIKYWKPGVSVSHTEREGRRQRGRQGRGQTGAAVERKKSKERWDIRGNNPSGTLGGGHMSGDGGRERRTGREQPKVRQGESECLCLIRCSSWG